MKLRDVRKGDLVVCGAGGVRIMIDHPDRSGRLRLHEQRHFVGASGRDEHPARRGPSGLSGIGKKIVVVAGPVVIHTGGIDAFSKLVSRGWVDALPSGNAIAVHDIENCSSGPPSASASRAETR